MSRAHLAAALDAVILDIGGTLVAEAAPGTPTSELRVTLLPQVIEDLTEIATSVRLAAATNTATMREAEVRALLQPCGLSDLLEVVVTSCDVGAAKPDPRILQVVLERLGGIAPGRALFIGDQPSDEAAANAIGMAYAPVGPVGLAATLAAWIDSQSLYGAS